MSDSYGSRSPGGLRLLAQLGLLPRVRRTGSQDLNLEAPISVGRRLDSPQQSWTVGAPTLSRGMDWSSPSASPGAASARRFGLDLQREPYPGPYAPGKEPRTPSGDQEIAAPELGTMVRARENAQGDPGLVSSGRGDAGGRSYGLYQFKSRKDPRAPRSVVEDFIVQSGYEVYFQGMSVNSEPFVAQFQALARSDPKFVAAQHDYARREYYDPALERLAKAGIDVSARGRGVQELIYSTSNQYGPSKAAKVITKALEGRDLAQLSDEDLIVAIADYKHRSTPSWFKSSPTQWKGIRNRFAEEREQALQMTREDADQP